MNVQIATWIAGGGLGAAFVTPLAAWRVALADSKRSAREGARWRAEIRRRDAAAPAW